MCRAGLHCEARWHTAGIVVAPRGWANNLVLVHVLNETRCCTGSHAATRRLAAHVICAAPRRTDQVALGEILYEMGISTLFVAMARRHTAGGIIAVTFRTSVHLFHLRLLTFFRTSSSFLICLVPISFQFLGLHLLSTTKR